MRNLKPRYDRFVFTALCVTLIAVIAASHADAIAERDVIVTSTVPVEAVEITPEPTVTPVKTVEPTQAVATLTPTPYDPYGGYTEAEHSLMAATILREAGVGAPLENMCAVGWVIYNRHKSPLWGEQTITGTIYRKGQFTVTRGKGFKKLAQTMPERTDDGSMRAKEAASMVLNGDDLYRLPASVMYFKAGHTKRWGRYQVYYKRLGNTFYHDKRAME